jgi:hypothetical protein
VQSWAHCAERLCAGLAIGAMRFTYCTSMSKQAVRWQQWFDNGAAG